MECNLGFFQDFYPIIYDNSKNSKTAITLIHNIVEFWGSNKDFWFSHEPIVYFPTISTMYESGASFDMALLLHYDQLFRHPCPSIHEYQKPIAFRFATSLALKMIHKPYFDSMETWKKVFILLTIRHNKNLKLKMFALSKTYSLLEHNPTDSLLLRFLNASILDINAFKNNNIGHIPFDCKMPTNDEFKYLLVDPIKNQAYNNREQYNAFYDAFDRLLGSNVSDKIAVSISGGVDSMIASQIANEWCTKNKKQLILLHINYGNRECCNDEIKMLVYWAAQLNAPLFIRTIDEIQRKRSSQYRTLYEDVTRRIRFSFYKYFKCPIILGHNKDDCMENIFSNLSKQIHFDNLLGMKSISYDLNDVMILRPMLEFNKIKIIEYADNNNIPHLEDSTPTWSRRGQMRDILIPSIENFDSKIIDGLYKFAIHSMKLSQQWFTWFTQWKQSSVHIDTSNNITTIAQDEFFKANYENIDFWIHIWFNCNLPTRPSNKSFRNMISCIRQTKHIHTNLNKQFIAAINPTNIQLKQVFQ